MNGEAGSLLLLCIIIYNTQFGLLGQPVLCMYTCILSFKLHGHVHEFAHTS